MNTLKTFNNNKPILVNGKCVMYYTKLNGKANRITVAREMIKQYPNCFSNVAEVLSTIRAYEKTNDFVWTDKVAYILHQA